VIRHDAICGVELRSTIPSQARDWRNQLEIRRWCRQYTLISQAQHAAWLTRIETDPTIKMFGIWGNDPQVIPHNGFVGVCGLTSIDRHNQSAEFSLYIAPEYHRRGYARNALTLLLLHGFWDYNLNRIWGESFDGNPAQRLFASLGMQHEGALRQSYFREGRHIDSHIWAMTREEFNARYLNRLGHGDKRPGRGGQPGPGGAEHDAAPAAAADTDWIRRVCSGTPFERWQREEGSHACGPPANPFGV
jgi:diamine N-acetyltransferase